MTIGDGTHNRYRYVVGKFISHTVQNSENKKKIISRWKSKNKNDTLSFINPGFSLPAEIYSLLKKEGASWIWFFT
jgi:hypothetical protein